MLPLHKIFLSLVFLLGGMAVSGRQANYPCKVSASLHHSISSNDFAHTSFEKTGELSLVATHQAYGKPQQAGSKQLAGYAAVHELPFFGTWQADLSSMLSRSSDRPPAHLVLIFPFHYFW